MTNQIFRLNHSQTKKFMGNKMEKEQKNSHQRPLVMEELELSSRFVVKTPNSVKVDSMQVMVMGEDRINISATLAYEKDGVTIYRNQDIIADYFKNISPYRWDELKNKVFDEEILSFVMTYETDLDYIVTEDETDYLESEFEVELGEIEVQKHLDLKNVMCELEITVQLIQNKSMNAHINRIAGIISEEILTDSNLVKDLFLEGEQFQKHLISDTYKVVLNYLKGKKLSPKIPTVTIARIVAKKYVGSKEIKDDIMVVSDDYNANDLTSELFSWDSDITMELDKKEEVINCLKRIRNRLKCRNIFKIPSQKIISYLDRHADNIKQLVTEQEAEQG